MDINLGYCSSLLTDLSASDLNVAAARLRGHPRVREGFDKGSRGCYLCQIEAIRAFDFS
jgi:hypothetical protein